MKLAANHYRHSASEHKSFVLLVALFVLGIAVPIVIGIHFGAFDIPHNDDWSERWVTAHYFKTGHLQMNSWIGMTFAGQVFLTMPLLMVFGLHQWVFPLLSVLSAMVAFFCGFVIVKRVTTPTFAFMSVLSLIITPGFWYGVDTYMTDLPGLAVSSVSILFFIKVVESKHRFRSELFVASVGFGIVGFSIRDYCGLPLLVIFSLSFVLFANKRRTIGIIAAITVSLLIIIFIWTSSISPTNPTLMLPSWYFFSRAARLVFTFALFISPAAIVLAASAKFRSHLKDKVQNLLLALAIVIALVFYNGTGPTGPFIGDYLQRNGILGSYVLAGTRPVLLGRPIMLMLIILTMISISILVRYYIPHLSMGAVIRSFRAESINPEMVIRVYLASGLLSVVGLQLIGVDSYDRFLWADVVLASGLIFSSVGGQEFKAVRKAIFSFGIPAVLICITSTALVLNAFSFDQARWKAGTTLVDMGFPARSIDAGFEWMGYYHGDSWVRPVLSNGAINQYVIMFTSGPIVATVSSSPINTPGFRLVGTTEYKLFGFFGNVELYLYRYLYTRRLQGVSATSSASFSTGII